MSAVVSVPFTDYPTSVSRAFQKAEGAQALAGFDAILLKPNLVDASPFPVTTHPEFTEAVIRTIRAHTDMPIVIGEGCGDRNMETDEVFKALGYTDLAARTGVELLDLNHAELIKLSNPQCTVFPEFWLPKVATTHAIVSLPVLKGHSMTKVTGTLKNMMGVAPSTHYQGPGGWKKSKFHAQLHQAIRDLNRYVTPHLTLMDASVGLTTYHLGGPPCDPPINRILAGTDPLALDREAARLLGVNWRDVGYLR
jgi:uncharacterized protein (DUF362 family)